MNKPNRYTAIIEDIFRSKFKKGLTEIPFDREEFVAAAEKLGLDRPKNLGDIIYSFRYRTSLPAIISRTAGAGQAWRIRPTGRGKYAFVLAKEVLLQPNKMMAQTKIPDATPGIVSMYAVSDEQALLAKVRYNRLIDTFTGVTCYSLQSHLRTSVPHMGQVETDEIYVGVDKKGAQYVFPIQAKGGKDKLGIVQIEQDMAVCASKFPHLVCRPIAAQFLTDGVIALFEFEVQEEELKIESERHYRLVSPDQLTREELLAYQRRGDE